MIEEVKAHLNGVIIPFWKRMRDDVNGGYYGYMDFESLKPDKTAVKGCILHSRILWFFSNAYELLGDETLLDEANHAYDFVTKHCIDDEKGGVYWSVTCDGKVNEDSKYTYNIAFCIYALSSYYSATGKKEALDKAYELFELIESTCKDEVGYLEAFTREFESIADHEISDNGVVADRTMNTVLHVFEAYTELYRVDKNPRVGECLRWIFDFFSEHVYNPELHRLEVFFNNRLESILDLHSFGHDIETAWLIDRGTEVLGDPYYIEKMTPLTKDLTAQVYKVAFDGKAFCNECEKGVIHPSRVWWVQAEAVVGFVNGYSREPARTEYLEAAHTIWNYIENYMVDKRPGSEWFWDVDINGEASSRKPIVERWKCPYHNGRMCFEIIKRGIE